MYLRRTIAVIILVLFALTTVQALEKNTAGQKWVVFCFDETDGTIKTGDSANITANVRIDGGAANAVDDTNPTELEDGYYIFDITAAESNGDLVLMASASSTANIQCKGEPSATWTVAPDMNSVTVANSAVDANITYVQEDAVPDGGDGLLDVNVMEVNGTDQTANDNAADINEILTDTGTTIPGTITTAQNDLDTITGTAGVLIGTDAMDRSGTLDVNTKTATATALDLILKNSTFALAIADAVWDEVLSAAGHNVATSAGRRLRLLEEVLAINEDTAQAGAAGSITLAAGESAVDDFYKGQVVVLTGGTGVGQARAIYGYTGSSKVALIRPNWATNPDATSEYAILSVGSTVVGSIDGAAVDEIWDETLPELTVSAPSAVPTGRTGLMFLYMSKRNKELVYSSGTQGEQRITNDAGTVITEADFSDDGSTFTKEEFGAVD